MSLSFVGFVLSVSIRWCPRIWNVALWNHFSTLKRSRKEILTGRRVTRRTKILSCYESPWYYLVRCYIVVILGYYHVTFVFFIVIHCHWSMKFSFSEIRPDHLRSICLSNSFCPLSSRYAISSDIVFFLKSNSLSSSISSSLSLSFPQLSYNHFSFLVVSFFSDTHLFRPSSVIILLFWFLSSCSYREYLSTSDRLLGSLFFLSNVQAFWSNSSPDEFYRKSCSWIDWDVKFVRNDWTWELIWASFRRIKHRYQIDVSSLVSWNFFEVSHHLIFGSQRSRNVWNYFDSEKEN